MSFLKKVLKFRRGKPKKDRYLIEISYGKGKRTNLGFIQSTDETLFDDIMKLISERPDKDQIKYIYVTFPNGARERFDNPLHISEEELEEEDQIEFTPTGVRRKRKAKVPINVDDPLDLLKDTSERLRKAYGLVMEETLKFQGEVFKGIVNMIGSNINTLVQTAVKEGIKEGMKEMSNVIRSSQGSSSDVLQFLTLLREMKKGESEKKRKGVKVEVVKE